MRGDGRTRIGDRARSRGSIFDFAFAFIDERHFEAMAKVSSLSHVAFYRRTP